ncbi:hypothetical protein CC2G_013915 [Coprinopsis cinerea AmutBmut pab1-1]|nr:hypothetical protein CC2G_013915 [Coprinopsis cinerea AmutBmut pab1-1]
MAVRSIFGTFLPDTAPPQSSAFLSIHIDHLDAGEITALEVRNLERGRVYSHATPFSLESKYVENDRCNIKDLVFFSGGSMFYLLSGYWNPEDVPLGSENASLGVDIQTMPMF